MFFVETGMSIKKIEENVYEIRYYRDGRKKDPKTGKPSNKGRTRILYKGSEPEAMAYYVSLVRAQPKTKTVIAPTLLQALPDFCLYYENNVSRTTYKDFLYTWKRNLEPFFGKLRPQDLTPPLIERYKQHRRSMITVRGNPPSMRTVSKELSNLAAMTTWMALPEINMASPLNFTIRGFTAKQTRAKAPTVPSRAEIIRFLRLMERPYRAIFATLYYGGLRRTEALTLTAERVNLSQGYMLVKGKGGKERIVPIFRKLSIYLRRRVPKGGWLFPNPETGKPYTDLRKPIKRSTDKAGMGHIWIHLLRHAFGTHSIQSGIDLRSLQLIMGHSTSQVTERYTHLAGFLNDAMDKFGGGSLRFPKSKKLNVISAT